jgi:hypothetical protein
MRLVRSPSTDQGTPGYLYDGDTLICRTLELPWRENRTMASCIPAGTYKVEYMARSASGKYTDVYHVTGVPDRSGILIHAGNYAGDRALGYASDLLGCIAPCMSIGVLTPAGRKPQTAGLSSKVALAKLHSITGRKPFTLEVVWTP